MQSITARQLADDIDADEQFTLIDTRKPESYDAWHIPGAINVPYGKTDRLSDEQVTDIGARIDGDPVVTTCAKGLTSALLAFDLASHGYEDMSVVSGGMKAWSKVYDVVPVETRHDDLIVRQIQRRATGCLGYVIGSHRAEKAVIVDPTRQVDQFKIAAQDAGVTVEAVVDTHVHADHVSGGALLARDCDVPYRLGERAVERDVEYDFDPLADGERIEVGDIGIEALHTPGHTTEMTSLLVCEELLLTGDALFVDSVGRTELEFGDADAADGAELLADSLHDTVLELPDATRILPAHCTVTSDGRFRTGTPGEPQSAGLGDLRSKLDLLGLDRESFVERVVSTDREKPSNHERIVSLNLGTDSLEDENIATNLELGPNNCAA